MLNSANIIGLRNPGEGGVDGRRHVALVAVPGILRVEREFFMKVSALKVQDLNAVLLVVQLEALNGLLRDLIVGHASLAEDGLVVLLALNVRGSQEGLRDARALWRSQAAALLRDLKVLAGWHLASEVAEEESLQ